MAQQFLDTEAAFALRARALVDRLADQLTDAIVDWDLKIITKTMGIVQLLYSEGAKSQTEIADRLRYSQQLAAQRLAWLHENKFVVSKRDPGDARRRLVQLTAAGMAEGKKLQSFLPVLAHAYDDLFQEIEIDLDAAVQTAERALEEKPLKARMMRTKKIKNRRRGAR